MKEQLTNTIKKLSLEKAESVSEFAELYRGFGSSSDILQEGYAERRDWAEDGFRHVSINEGLFSIITYCEGDLTLSVSPDQESFQKEVERAEKFYKQY